MSKKATKGSRDQGIKWRRLISRFTHKQVNIDAPIGELLKRLAAFHGLSQQHVLSASVLYYVTGGDKLRRQINETYLRWKAKPDSFLGPSIPRSLDPSPAAFSRRVHGGTKHGSTR